MIKTLAMTANYINHHQIPLCDALYEALGEGFVYVEQRPMEEERRAMGWEEEKPAYVVRAWEDRERADALILAADVAVIGWAEREDLIESRMRGNQPTIRISERIYREGQWKFLSPRGLLHKYREHIRYRRGPLWMLAIGAYTASDFNLIHAYPGKLYRWGYFPPFERADEETLFSEKGQQATEILWAARFLPLKHPELALHAMKELKEAGIRAHLTMIGDGELRQQAEAYCREQDLAQFVTFTGFLTPEETRARMRGAHIFLFNSDHREGWGAVVSEAMGAGMAVIAGNEAGGPATLIREGENGLLYRGTDQREFTDLLKQLVQDPDRRECLGRAAYHTVADLWNAEHAAAELLRFAEDICAGREYEPPKEGPLSRDPGRKPYR